MKAPGFKTTVERVEVDIHLHDICASLRTEARELDRMNQYAFIHIVEALPTWEEDQSDSRDGYFDWHPIQVASFAAYALWQAADLIREAELRIHHDHQEAARVARNAK